MLRFFFKLIPHPRAEEYKAAGRLAPDPELQVMWGRMILALLTLITVVWCAFGSWFTVSPGYTGVVTRMGGVQEGIYGEGVHLKLPLIETYHEVNTQNLTFAGKGIDAGTKDLQGVMAEVAVIFSVDAVDAKEVYRNYRNVENLQARALQPAIEESFKSAAAAHTAEELITKRAGVREMLMKTLRDKLKPHYVTVKDVNITNFAFSKGFSEAVEAKVTAAEQAKKAEHDLDRITTEGKQRVATAEAEAKAIKAQAEAVNKQGGAEYVQLKWIEKWDGKLPSTQLGSNTSTLMNLSK